MHDLLPEFFDRILGAFIFIAAVSAFIYQFNQISTSSTEVKQNYANDAVYSEASLKVTDEDVITRTELIAMIAACPNKHLVIKDSVSGYVVETDCGIGQDNTIKFEKSNTFTVDATVISFGKNRWDPSQMDFDEWFQASQYQMSDVTDAAGEAVSVMIYGV